MLIGQVSSASSKRLVGGVLLGSLPDSANQITDSALVEGTEQITNSLPNRPQYRKSAVYYLMLTSTEIL